MSKCANYAPVRCSTITQVLVTLETKSACHVFSGFLDLFRPTRYRIASNSTSARCPAYHLSVGFGDSRFLVTKILNERQLRDKKSFNSLCGTKNCFKPSVQLIESSFLLSGVRFDQESRTHSFFDHHSSPSSIVHLGSLNQHSNLFKLWNAEYVYLEAQ